MEFSKTYVILLLLSIFVQNALFSQDDNSKYRLPPFHIPKSYNVSLKLNPDLNTFSGIVDIYFATTQLISSIFVHVSPTRITKINRALLNYVHECEVSYSDKNTEILNVTCPPGLEKNDESHLVIDYEGIFGTAGSEDEYYGLYKSSYRSTEGMKMYAATQFEPTFARTVFPCFDEPELKAPFDVTVEHPDNYTVLFNTGVEKKKSGKGIVTTKFKLTPPISTYLIAFLVSNFESTSVKYTSKPAINVYTRGNQIEYTSTAIQYGRGILNALGDWLGFKYEEFGIDKLDLVAVPDFIAGAMENWGLITFQEAFLLDEGKQTSASAKQRIIETIAHELAHQWFGDYVTLDWWSNTWVNEGLATYFQFHIPDKVQNVNMELERQFVPLCLHTAFEADGSESSPLSSVLEQVNTPTDDLNKFDTISYNKGASILRMIKGIVGEKKFQKGLRGYLIENDYSTGSAEKLLSCFDEFYVDRDFTIEDVFKNWVYKSGYPIINVHFNDTTNKSVVVSQKVFPSNMVMDDNTSKLWTVPITYTTSNDTNFEIKDVLWLDKNKTLEIPLQNDSWIILNLQQTGYYRVNYNVELWNRIISALSSKDMKKIHVANRAQLIDDVFSLAKVGRQNYQIAFNLTSYLYREVEFEPWYAAAKSLKYISMMLEVHGDKSALKNLQTLVLGWIYSAFPLEMKIGVTSHLQVRTIEVIKMLKCYMNDRKCLNESKNILKEYISGHKIQDNNLRQFGLCYGLKKSKTPNEDYASLLKFYQQSNSAIERRDILASLGCLSDSGVLKKYLSELLSNKTVISRTDVKYVYRAITSDNLQGLEVTLPFLKEHLKDILNRYSGLITLSDLVLAPAKWISSDEQLNQLKEITEKYKDVEGMKKIAGKALELPSIHNHWFKHNKKDIEFILSAMTSSSIFVVPNMFLLAVAILSTMKFY